MSQKLRKIMVEDVVTAEPNASAKAAVELMNKHGIGCLVVIKGEKVLGIVTERDMMKRIMCKSVNPSKTRVSEIMSSPVITATPDMRAGDAAKLMIESDIKKLPVVEAGQLVGLVTLTDLIRSEGVADFLNGLSLNGAAGRMKRVVALYSDPEKLQRRKCPLIANDGFLMICQEEKCMWWLGDECAVTRISGSVYGQQYSELRI